MTRAAWALALALGGCGTDAASSGVADAQGAGDSATSSGDTVTPGPGADTDGPAQDTGQSADGSAADDDAAGSDAGAGDVQAADDVPESDDAGTADDAATLDDVAAPEDVPPADDGGAADDVAAPEDLAAPQDVAAPLDVAAPEDVAIADAGGSGGPWISEDTPCTTTSDCLAGNACSGWHCNDLSLTCENLWGPADCCVDASDCDDQNPCTKDVCFTAQGSCIHNALDCPVGHACQLETGACAP